MELSVEEGFSFLDLEDCDAEDKSYLNAILGGKRGSDVLPTGLSDALDSKPLTTGSSATGEQTIVNIRNEHLTQSLEPRACEAYQYADKTFLEATENTSAGNHPGNQGISINSGSTLSEKPNISVASNTNPSVLAAPRGILGGQHPLVYHGNSQTPQPAKVKPIQKTPISSSTSSYLPEASQVGLFLCSIAQGT